MTRLPSPVAIWRWIVTQTYWRWRLARLGRRSILFRPLLVTAADRIAIGERTSIREGARLEAISRPEIGWRPRLTIGSNVNIEQGAHIVCQCAVTIEDGVSITPYCVIVDTDHPYNPPDGLPKIGARLPDKPSHVHIGEGTFIGAHSVILPNVRIGRFCVIGAGSVVTRDLPDYCIANGAPARIVKVFNPLTRQWTRT